MTKSFVSRHTFFIYRPEDIVVRSRFHKNEDKTPPCGQPIATHFTTVSPVTIEFTDLALSL